MQWALHSYQPNFSLVLALKGLEVVQLRLMFSRQAWRCSHIFAATRQWEARGSIEPTNMWPQPTTFQWTKQGECSLNISLTDRPQRRQNAANFLWAVLRWFNVTPEWRSSRHVSERRSMSNSIQWESRRPLAPLKPAPDGRAGPRRTEWPLVMQRTFSPLEGHRVADKWK